MTRRRLFYLLAPLTVLIAVLTAIASCSDPLGPDYGLDSSRILAVRANPPDLVPGGNVVLDALVFVPSPTDNVTYEWSWCAAVDENLACAETPAALEAQLDSGSQVDYTLGTGATARFAYPVDPALLKTLCARVPTDAGTDAGDDASTDDAGDDDAGDGGDAGDAGADAGVSLTCDGTSVTVTVLLKVTVNGKEMRAAKQLTIYPTQPTFTNTNPTIDGLESFDHAVTPPADGGDRSDDGIADAAGDPTDASTGISRSDNGGVQLLLRVPTTASDSYTPGNGGGGGGGGGGGTGGGTGTGTGAGNPTTDDAGDDAGDDDGGGEPSDAGGQREGGPGGGNSDGGGGNDAGNSPPIDDGGADDAGDIGNDATDDDAGGAAATDGGAVTAGNTLGLHESLTATWYVQAGLLDSVSTTLTAATGTAARDYTSLVFNRWVPPGPGVYTVVVVLRDNRNGVGWYVQPIRVH